MCRGLGYCYLLRFIWALWSLSSFFLETRIVLRVEVFVREYMHNLHTAFS